MFTNRQVLLVTLVGLVLFSFGDISETFKPLFFAYKDIPLTFFGILFGVTFILSAIGSFSTQWLTERFGNRRMLLFALLLSPALLLVATRLPGMWAGAFVVAGSVLWGLELIIMSIVINEELASAHRATVLSISNLIRKLGVIVTALVFGLITDVFSINTTFVIVALCSFSAFFLAILLRGDAQPAGQS